MIDVRGTNCLENQMRVRQMTDTVRLSTQGISDDWASADGNFDTRFRGMLNRDQVMSALFHLSPLELPEGMECPPYVIVEGTNGTVSFIGQGGAVECVEAETDVTPEQGAALAFGEISIQSLAEVIAPPPPPMAPPPPPQPKIAPEIKQSAAQKTDSASHTPASSSTAAPIARPPAKAKTQPSARKKTRAQSKGMKAAGLLGGVLGAAMGGGMTGGTDGANLAATGMAAGIGTEQGGTEQGKTLPPGLRRKNTWRQYMVYLIAGLLFIGVIFSVIGIFAAPDQDGKMAAGLGVIVLGGITWGLLYLTRKNRPWTDDEGNIYTGVMMAEMFDIGDAISDDDNGYYDDGD